MPPLASHIMAGIADLLRAMMASGCYSAKTEIVRALNQPEVKEKLLNTGVEAASSSPDELAVSMKSEIAKVAS